MANLAGIMNIGGDEHDAFHRYKMPRLLVKVEGSGKMIKTFVPNMDEIGKALQCPWEYILKWLGYRRNVNTNLNRGYISGRHDMSTLQADLAEFIDIFVLCPTCGLPETTMVVSKRGISLSCRGCAAHHEVQSKDDVGHKMIDFIIKHVKSKKSGKDEKKEKRRKEKGGDKEEKTERKSKSSTAENSGANGEAEQVEEVVGEVTLDSKQEHCIERLRFFMGRNTNVDDIVNELHRLSDESGFDASARIRILFFVLFDYNIRAQIEKSAPIATKVVKTKEAMIVFLQTFEELCQDDKDIIRFTAHIFKAFYDNDIVEEDAFLDWAATEGTGTVGCLIREKAQPFIEWLKNAEEESDEED